MKMDKNNHLKRQKCCYKKGRLKNRKRNEVEEEKADDKRLDELGDTK